MPVGTVVAWRSDPKTFRFTYVSEEAVDLLGYLPDRWLHEPDFWQSHIHPEDRERAVSFCVTASARQVPYEFEYRMIAQDGRVVWVWDAVHLIVEGGKVRELIGVMVDITARKAREEELVQSVESYRNLVEHAPDYILTLAVDGTILLVNQTMPDLRKEEVIGASLYDYLNPEDRERVGSYLAGVFRTGEPVGFEISRTPLAGPTVWFWARLAPLKHEDRVVAAVMISREITIRRQAEEALRESESGLRAFLDAVPEMMFRIRRDGTLLDFKSGRSERPALSPQEFLGRKLKDLFGESFAQEAGASVEKALASRQSQTLKYRMPVPYPGGELQEYEAEIIPSAGEEVVALVRSVPGPSEGIERLARNAGEDLMLLFADARKRCEALLHSPRLDPASRLELEGILRCVERSSALMRQFLVIPRR